MVYLYKSDVWKKLKRMVTFFSILIAALTLVDARGRNCRQSHAVANKNDDVFRDICVENLFDLLLDARFPFSHPISFIWVRRDIFTISQIKKRNYEPSTPCTLSRTASASAGRSATSPRLRSSISSVMLPLTRPAILIGLLNLPKQYVSQIKMVK